MNIKLNKNLIKIRNFTIDLLKMILGTIIMAIGIEQFLLPNQLSTGGFAGMGTVLYYMFNIPVGTTIFILNIPLFIIAYFKVGKKFLIKAVIGTFLLTVFLHIFQNVKAVTTDRFLAFMYGSIITGIGTAIVLKASGSTGGTELAAIIIRSYKPQMQTGTLIIIFDTIIVIVNTIFFKEIEIALYSALAIYIMGKILDIFFEGIDFAKMLIIISPKWEEISNSISFELKRGVTALQGKGMFKRQEKNILLCVTPRAEVREVRKIIEEIDPSAFIIITNAREVYRRGL